MNKDKEPLMSAEKWYYNQLSKQSGKTMSNFEITKAYAKYHTEWHLRQCSEVVREEAKTELTSTCIRVDKQSITNAIENYIKENL